MEETYKVKMDYIIQGNTDEETRMLEKTEYQFAKMARQFAREIAIKKDNAILNTWFSSLRDDELLKIDLILKTIMKERGLIK